MAKTQPLIDIAPLTNVTHIELNSRADDLKAGLIDTFLNLDRIDANLYLARHLLKGRNSLDAVYGGQVVGQSLAAAIATVDEAFVPHSLHSYFIKTGSVNKPILYMIDPIRNGRSFCTRIIKAVQDGEAIFSCQISFHKKEQDAIVHQHKMPDVPQPSQLREARLIAEDYMKEGDDDRIKHIIEHYMKEMHPAFERVFEVRPVDPAEFLMAEVTAPHNAIWIKARENIGEDHRLHQCVATYLTDLTMVTTASRPHVSHGFVPSMMFSLDHCVWLHERNFRVDEWMLYETVSSKANGSRAFIEGRLWTHDGKLIISTAQEALIRKSKNGESGPK